jgi:hypothetical protein
LVAEAAEIGGHQKLSDAVDGEDRPDGDAAQAEALGAGLQVWSRKTVRNAAVM